MQRLQGSCDWAVLCNPATISRTCSEACQFDESNCFTMEPAPEGSCEGKFSVGGLMSPKFCMYLLLLSKIG
jgi:hypothetical protein